MVKETNPGVWEKAQHTEAPHAEDHGYRTIAEIMTALNPFTGEFYRETLQMSRLTREMFCLMEGRHVHPSTLYPGGVGTVPTVQLFTDYLVRLMKYVEFMKKVVPLHDDLFDFFYEALPGYEKVGERRVLLGCWGSFQDPAVCDYKYENMNAWGNKMFVTPGIVVDGKLVTTDLVDINLGIRILLGSSYYDDWNDGEMFVKTDPLGNPVDRNHPWNQTTTPRPQKRDFDNSGICIGCTMPGFPDKFMPFMDEPPGATVSAAAVGLYGRAIRALRAITNSTVDKEPKWRHKGSELTTGYRPQSY
jgi:hydrogenase large subunit